VLPSYELAEGIEIHRVTSIVFGKRGSLRVRSTSWRLILRACSKQCHCHGMMLLCV
jgi:hypothetical protein